MFNPRKYLLATAAVATALTLSACTGGTSGMDTGETGAATSAPSASAKFDEADVTFAQLMIPHHEQAVEMSELILAKDGVDERVIDLATQIKAAQDPEITQLTTWLEDWGTDEAGMSGMPGMDHGTDGMMSDDDMTALEDAPGPDASKLFLEQMTMHHQGAVDMAQTELDEGESPDAKTMAQGIKSTQTEEIAVMNDILATL